MVNSDIYIKILEFGINRTEGFTYDEIINTKEFEDLKQWEKDIIDSYLLNAFRNKQHIDLMKSADYETLFVIIKHGGSSYKDGKIKYALNLDSRFKYIDYIELIETRKMAMQASSSAKIALWFVVGTIIISIILTLWQIKSPVEIKETQIDKIINAFNNINKN